MLVHDKRKTMECHYKGEEPPVKAEVKQSAKNNMCIIFWDCQGILLVDFKERNAFVSSEYCVALIHKVKDILK